MMVAGDRRTARDMTRFLFERQQLPNGSMPRNSLTNGKPAPDSFNTQLDECAYPLVMALANGLTSPQYYRDHIVPAANFVATRGPSFGPERWEEQDGFSPSTLAAEIAGLLAAARIARINGDGRQARVWRATADEFQRNLKAWTLTTNGPLHDEPYFIRLSKTGDPDEAIDYNIGNGGPTLDQREVIDAGFLEYARLGVLVRERSRTSCGRSTSSTPRSAAPPTPARASSATTATATATAPRTGARGRPSKRATATCGPSSPASAGSTSSTPATWGRRSSGSRRCTGRRRVSASSPSRPGSSPDLARSPFGTDPTIASIGFRTARPPARPRR